MEVQQPKQVLKAEIDRPPTPASDIQKPHFDPYEYIDEEMGVRVGVRMVDDDGLPGEQIGGPMEGNSWAYYHKEASYPVPSQPQGKPGAPPRWNQPVPVSPPVYSQGQRQAEPTLLQPEYEPQSTGIEALDKFIDAFGDGIEAPGIPVRAWGRGIFDGFVEAERAFLSFGYNLITHPIDTVILNPIEAIRDLTWASYEVSQDIGGFGTALKEGWNVLGSGDRAYLLGNIGGNIAGNLLLGGAQTKAVGAPFAGRSLPTTSLHTAESTSFKIVEKAVRGSGELPGARTWNPVELVKTLLIVRRAIKKSISVKPTLGSSTVKLIDNQPTIFLNCRASLTAAIEEYSQARQLQNHLKLGYKPAYLESTERIFLEELRTKTRLAGAAEHRLLGGRELGVDANALRSGFIDYKAKYQAYLRTLPPGRTLPAVPEVYLQRYRIPQKK